MSGPDASQRTNSPSSRTTIRIEHTRTGHDLALKGSIDKELFMRVALVTEFYYPHLGASSSTYTTSPSRCNRVDTMLQSLHLT